MDYPLRCLAIPVSKMQAPVQFRKKKRQSPKIWSRPDELVRLYQLGLRGKCVSNIKNSGGHFWSLSL